MKPPRNIRTYKSYEEAAEAAREQAVEDYYTKQEDEEDPMDEADRRYDEWQDEMAGEE